MCCLTCWGLSLNLRVLSLKVHVLKGLFDDYFHLMQGVLLLVLLLRVTLLWKLTAAVSAFTVCVVAEGIVA